MSLFSILAKNAPNKVFYALVASAFSGVVYTLLIPLVMNSLPPVDGSLKAIDDSPHYFLGLEISRPQAAAAFAVAILFVWLLRTCSDVMLTRVSISMASRLRVQMYEQIAQAPLAEIERIGLPRLVAALTWDLPQIVQGAQTVPSALSNGITVIGMLLFLFYLNTEVFWFVLKYIGFGIVTTELIYRLSGRYFVRASAINDSLQESIHGLIQGFKELKLSNDKRANYFQWVLLPHEEALSKAQKAGLSIHFGAAYYGQALSFSGIGAVIFIFVSYHPITNESLVGVVITLLYISSPIGALVIATPVLKTAKISLRRIMELFAELPGENIVRESVHSSTWERMRLERVTYQHRARGDANGFKLGAVDLVIRKREITFIVGGNGSGKSTLSKILTLHYHPTAGNMYFDDQRITSENINSYRQRIAAVYSDYHLFDRILAANWDDNAVRHYLRLLGLEEKVTCQNGRFSTLSLSDGQRRRMALVAAFVEDKDLYLFDEWAADQDPAFKEVFYRQILPSLRSRGKAVVVITHDDRHFDIADTLIVMDEGKLRSVGHIART